MIYEVINQGDGLTIRAASDQLAAIAILTLGGGSLGCRAEDGRTIPCACLGLEGQAQALLDDLGLPGQGSPLAARLDAYLRQHAAELAEVFESAVYLRSNARRALEVALEGLPDKAERLQHFNYEVGGGDTDLGRAFSAAARAMRSMAAGTLK